MRTLGAVGVVQLDHPVDVAKATRAALEGGRVDPALPRPDHTMPPYVTDDDDVARICRAVARDRGRLMAAPTGWDGWLADRAAAREDAGLTRRLHPRAPDDPVTDLAGNDYLGLGRHPPYAVPPRTPP